MKYKLIESTLPKEAPIVDIIFNNRGISPDMIHQYFFTSDENILNPNLIDNIKEGAIMLFSHIQNNDSIFMVVDEDADGYTSSAILLNYLHALVPKYVESKIKYWVHEKKQHGIILDAIPEDTKLVIALDASSNEFELHKILAEKGIDVLIIDHHHAEKFSEYACVINNQMCDYPTKSLSGAGMTFKFCTYLDSLRDTNFANNFIDLAALGIISDMMDLRDLETRHIVSTGLSQVRNPFFKTMIKRNQRSIGDDLTPMGVAFYVTPFINAVTRIGNQDDKILMFESMLDFKAYEIIPSTKRGCSGQTETRVEQACRNCSNIKSRQAILRDKSLLTIENIIEEEHLLENKILAVRLADTSLDKNLTGLVANQIMGKYQKPVLILNKIVKEDGEIYWEGSGRGYGLEDTRQFLQDSMLVEFAEGHAQAFGVSIKDKNFDVLIKYVNEQLMTFDFTPCYKVDFVYQANNFDSNDILEIAELKSIWGQGIEEPYVALENVKVTARNIRVMNGGTIKITLPNKVELIKFKMSEEEIQSLCPSENKIIYIDIVGTCEKNIWNGRFMSVQIKIEDLKIREIQYDF